MLASASLAHAQVGVSVNIGEPGFFGQIDIGNMPHPPVVYANPIIVQAPPTVVVSPPLYLRVPPEHHKHWEKHCREYNACGRQVYFVTDDWYANTYAPQYAREHGHGHHDHEDHDHDHGHGHGHDEDHDHGHHEEH